MHRGDHAFFHNLGGGGIVVDTCYDLAFFWKSDPDRYLAKPISRLALDVAQTERILATLETDADKP